MSSPISRRKFSVSAAGLLAATQIGAASAHAQAATPVASAPEADLDAAIDRLPGVIEQMLADSGVPGAAVAVVTENEVLFADGFGVRSVDAADPVTAETVFQLASVSKPVGSTVVASVVGQGGVNWSTPVAEIFPEFALSDPWVTAHVTVADLYSHRSGLPDHAMDELEDLGGERDEVLDSLRYVELAGRFRDSYAYTNFGLTAAAEAVARAEGTTWEALAEEHLFAPAGMTQTSFRHDDFVARENRALGHIRKDGAWVQEFDRQPDAQSPAGGCSSSVTDLTRWMQLQLGHGSLDGESMIDPTALGETHLPHIISSRSDSPFDDMPGFYGLGWNVSYDADKVVTLSHSGAFLMGAATAVYLWPADGVGIVALTNGQPVGLPEAICLAFRDLYTLGEPALDYLAALGPFMEAATAPQYGSDVAKAPADPLPAAESAAYVGTYANDAFGALEIRANGSNLTMVIGPLGMEFPLSHHDRDVFSYTPIGENAGALSAVTFTLDATRQASSVVVENLNIYGAGTFTRQN